MKLDTERGMLTGYKACSDFLIDQVSKLFEQPAVLDTNAQEVLLAEVSPVFTRRISKLSNLCLIRMRLKKFCSIQILMLLQAQMVLRLFYTKNTGTCLVTIYFR